MAHDTNEREGAEGRGQSTTLKQAVKYVCHPERQAEDSTTGGLPATGCGHRIQIACLVRAAVG